MYYTTNRLFYGDTDITGKTICNRKGSVSIGAGTDGSKEGRLHWGRPRGKINLPLANRRTSLHCECLPITLPHVLGIKLEANAICVKTMASMLSA